VRLAYLVGAARVVEEVIPDKRNVCCNIFHRVGTRVWLQATLVIYPDLGEVEVVGRVDELAVLVSLAIPDVVVFDCDGSGGTVMHSDSDVASQGFGGRARDVLRDGNGQA